VNTTATFSTKASTYFAAALPILNSMNGDLQNLVALHGLGFNYIGGDRASLRRCLEPLNDSTLLSLSLNCARFFAAELDLGKIREDMLVFLRQCLQGRAGIWRS
jgi:hypothetical protein